MEWQAELCKQESRRAAISQGRRFAVVVNEGVGLEGVVVLTMIDLACPAREIKGSASQVQMGQWGGL